MNDSPAIKQVKFNIGEVIHHKLFHYRGVIVDVDPDFQLSQKWYQMVARSRPPQDEPWYHVLVHDSEDSTYVAEQNLEADQTAQKISHPGVEQCFCDFKDGHYISNEKIN